MGPESRLTPGKSPETKSEQNSKFPYFAYGSNMFSCRLCHRRISAEFLATGYVGGRRLTFDKISEDGSGKCDIEQTANQNDRVYGVLYNVLSEDESRLDDAEGLGNGYRKEEVDIVTTSGVRQAKVYIATKKASALRPYHWYKTLVIAGAVEHGLPKHYVECLRTIDSVEDPDKIRRSKEEELLFST